MISLSQIALGMGIALSLLSPDIALGSVESTLNSIQTKLIGSILPLAAILGLVFAGFSFVAGSPNARSHLILAIVGTVIGFAAPSIIDFLRSMVH